eukprot:6180921-Pleurochrysis_carterae.AAC.2
MDGYKLRIDGASIDGCEMTHDCACRSNKKSGEADLSTCMNHEGSACEESSSPQFRLSEDREIVLPRLLALLRHLACVTAPPRAARALSVQQYTVVCKNNKERKKGAKTLRGAGGPKDCECGKGESLRHNTVNLQPGGKRIFPFHGT